MPEPPSSELAARHRLHPGENHRLADHATAPPKGSDHQACRAQFRELRERLADLQRRLYAEGRQRVLIILQATDTGGKDSTIRKVFRGVNPQGVNVHGFKAPSPDELARDYLWRVHAVVPQSGMIRVFNRSHYEDVLVPRIENLVPEATWRRRFDHINAFEQMLTDEGTTILKFYLHISPEEQLQRIHDRLTESHKHWKFSEQDLHKRQLWDDMRTAYDDLLTRCTTPWAPWHVVPADTKWYRNLIVTATIVDALERLDPQYPAPGPEVDTYRNVLGI